MSNSGRGHVVFSYKPVDTSSGDPVTVTLAPEYDKVQEKTQVNWTVAATQLLIASWVTRKAQFRAMPSREVYSLISNDLKEMGYVYTGDQCGIKWRSLKSSFLKVKSAMSSRDKPSTWVHYQAMADALQEEPACPDPHPVQETSAPDSPHDTDSSDTKDTSPPHTSPPHTSPPPPQHTHTDINTSRRKTAPAPKQKPTAQMKTVKRKYEWMKCFGEMKEEWRTRREERRRMHEERMELGRRKLRLMEELINVLKSK